jgi:hypothetical protein
MVLAGNGGPAQGAVVSAASVPWQPAVVGATSGNCLYSGGSIAALERFERRNRVTIRCALVYNDAAADWAGWVRPWNAVHPNPDWNWSPWVRDGKGSRHLIITQSLVPSGVPDDWRRRGARGEYDRYARELARNLIARGLGASVIRLGHEPNGSWYHHGLGSDPSQYRNWARLWARTVRAMRSVPGADFRFDLSISAGYRPISLRSYYPGDDVVDFIGVDLYDGGPVLQGMRDPGQRWNALSSEDGGLLEIARFARRHGKRLSLPEWGLRPRSLPGGGGDNPGFVSRVARFARAHHVAYQCYFNRPTNVVTLDAAPASRKAYRAARFH